MSATGSTTVGLCLDPLDVLFFRDGKPFGAATRAQSGLPMPQTLAGAVWTALLEKHARHFTRLVDPDTKPRTLEEVIARAGAPAWLAGLRVRGPWPARLGTDRQPEVLVPVPATIQRAKDRQGLAGAAQRFHLLRPLPLRRDLPGWQPPEPGLRPLWLQHHDPTEPAGGYLTAEGLRAFCQGQAPTGEQVVGPDDLFSHDHRIGIGIEPDRLSAQESLIYAASFLALQPGSTGREFPEWEEPAAPVVLYAEVVLPPGAPAAALAGVRALPLGGEGRRVRVELCEPAGAGPPVPAGAAGQKPLVLLTTPGLFESGWKPKWLAGRLVAAAVPGYTAVSGWDLARGGPKPNRFAAAAGSVYFLDRWPDEWPDALSDRDEDRAQGWGCFVRGVWTDE